MEDTASASPAPPYNPPVNLLMELVAQQQQLSAWIKQTAVKEMNLRLKIIQLAWPNAKIGTNNLSLVNQALQLKAVIQETATADEAGLQDIVDTIPNNAKLLGWKPVISVSKFKLLPDEEKAKLKDHVTIKVGAPQFSVEGEVPAPNYLQCITVFQGSLRYIDAPISDEQALGLANYFGFATAAELVTFVIELG